MRHTLLLTALVLLTVSCRSQVPVTPIPATPPAAQQPTQPPGLPQVIGTVELPISTVPRLSGQALTFREGDVTFTSLSAATVQTDAVYTYIRARFEVKNNSATPFNNLTLVAVARSGNVGGTAVKSVSDLGGAGVADQAGVVTQMTPLHSVTVGTGGTLTLVSGAEDFQAFTPAEVDALKSQAGWSAQYGAQDLPLNYGFVARSGSSRTIAAQGGTGTVNVVVRLPRGATTVYNFVLNFAFVDQDTTRVTRSVLPPETQQAASARLSALSVNTGGEVMTIGEAVTTPTAGRSDVTVSDLNVTSTQATSVWDTAVWDAAVWR
ncbi:hypothetical protein [Deinococcus sp. ME38]|uniref:hypothetical protein n=1 Tax=Deinococcus sp. ME38 TaxID=3400344 RepID=UPI003B5A5797